MSRTNVRIEPSKEPFSIMLNPSSQVLNQIIFIKNENICSKMLNQLYLVLIINQQVLKGRDVPEGRIVMRVSSRTRGRESLSQDTSGRGCPSTRQLNRAVWPGNSRRSTGWTSKGGRSDRNTYTCQLSESGSTEFILEAVLREVRVYTGVLSCVTPTVIKLREKALMYRKLYFMCIYKLALVIEIKVQ